jgi:hypothetical protein
VGEKHADSLIAGAQVGADRARLARHGLFDFNARRIDQQDLGIDEAECVARVSGRLAREPGRALPRRAVNDAGEDPAKLPVAAFQVSRQAVVALGQPRQLIIAGHRDGSRQVARLDPVHGRGDRPKRPCQLRGEQIRDEDGQQGRQDDREEQEAGDRDLAVRQALREHEEKTESGQGQHRGSDECDGQPCPERKPGAHELGARPRVLLAGLARGVRIVRHRKATRSAVCGCLGGIGDGLAAVTREALRKGAALSRLGQRSVVHVLVSVPESGAGRSSEPSVSSPSRAAAASVPTSR